MCNINLLSSRWKQNAPRFTLQFSHLLALITVQGQTKINRTQQVWYEHVPVTQGVPLEQTLYLCNELNEAEETQERKKKHTQKVTTSSSVK